MATSAKTSFGSKLYRGGTDGPPRTNGAPIEEVSSIDLPEEVADALDATSHDSAAAESIPGGITDGGEVAIELLYSGKTGQELLRGDLGGNAGAWYINLAGGEGQKQLYFSALVTRFRLGAAARGNAITASATLKITGAVGWATQAA